MQIDFDDEIPDLTGKGQPVARKPFVPRPPLVQGTPPPQYVPVEKRFEESAPSAKGAGALFRFAGATLGRAFIAKARAGKFSRRSPESRAKARAAKALKRQAVFNSQIILWCHSGRVDRVALSYARILFVHHRGVRTWNAQLQLRSYTS